MQARRRQRSSPSRELTLKEALLRVDNPHIAESLSLFYAHLARAQAEQDKEGIDYIRGAIAEAMQGVPDGPIDMPLSVALRKLKRKRRR
jgi:hypothetical protein